MRISPVLAGLRAYPFVRLAEARRRLERRRRAGDRLRDGRAARGDAGVHPRGAGARPALQVPGRRRAARAARGDRRLGRAAVRHRARPGDRGRADVRLQGGGLPPRAGVRRRARGRARSPPIRSTSGARRSPARRSSSSRSRRATASCPTSTPCRPRSGAAPRCCGSTTRTTRRRRPRRLRSTSRRPPWPASTTSCSPPTRRTPSCTSATSRRPRRSSSRTARTWRCSTRSPSAPRCLATGRASWPASAELVAALKRYRPNVGVAPPEFIQRAAAVAWGDEDHVAEVRDLYRAKRDVAAAGAGGARHAPRGRRRDVLPVAGGRGRGRARAAARAAASCSLPARTSGRPARATCGWRSSRRWRSASGRPRYWPLCSAALRPPQVPLRGQASTAPVWELRRNRRLSAPLSSSALTTSPSGSVTRVPAVEVQARLDHAVVAERDPEAGVGAQQAALADRDDRRAAAGERAHDRRAAADVGPVADDHAGADPALDHRVPERAGVEVDEALVHDRRAVGQVGAEAHAVGVGDPHPRRDDVVGHARELVDREDLERLAGRARRCWTLRQRGGVDGAVARPGDVVEHAEEAVEVGLVGPDQAVREQVQAQVGVVGVVPAGRPARRSPR